MGDGTKENPFTREDVLRLIKENGGKAEGLDLSGKVFEKGIDLRGFDLSGVNLENAYLVDAHLENASLFSAHLENSVLVCAHLQNADLSDSNLAGAHLTHAQLNSNTLLEDVKWGNYILGEEMKGYLESAVDTYRYLKMWYTNAGIADTAAKFYYREKEANRKSIKWRSKHWNDRFAAELMRVGFGYGERWWNILGWMALVVFGSTVAYYLSGELNLLYSLYFSVISFTALGYGKWVDITPQGWVQALGAFESLVGISMMALLLVTFVRKWTR